MLEPQISSIRNILKGKIVEMKLEHEIIRVKIDVGVLFYVRILLYLQKRS